VFSITLVFEASICHVQNPENPWYVKMKDEIFPKVLFAESVPLAL